jgi:TM2 domain-containing membrane protein YozV
MGLSTQEQMLVEQRVTNDAKSAGAAYLLCIFLGGLGAHRFYLGRTGSGAAMLILFILGWVLLAVVVGLPLLIAVWIWAFVDLFLIGGMVQQAKQESRQRISQEMLMRQGSTA